MFQRLVDVLFGPSIFTVKICFLSHDHYDITHYAAFICTEQPLQWISSFPCDHKLRLFSVLITGVSTVNILVSINYIMCPDVSVLYKHVQINTLI